MAQDYAINSVHICLEALPNLPPSVSDVDKLIGGTATDDGFWNIGDLAMDFSAEFFEGHYTANGHLFLVFSDSDFTFIRSPTADTNDPGYPATFADLPALTTTPLAVCFASGTSIATPDGERLVEDLRIGDAILSAERKAITVKWVRRQTVWTLFGPPERLLPVRVRAGALGDGLPERDLVLTADHALLIDGLLINAGALVNGGSIDYVPLSELGESYTVFHIETENHDVILAEGTPAETYIDYVGRQAFDNYAEYVALYGEEQTISEMPAPRISAARQLPTWLRATLKTDKAA